MIKKLLKKINVKLVVKYSLHTHFWVPKSLIKKEKKIIEVVETVLEDEKKM